MTIFFRVDASLDIGSGHVMRCLTLADALRYSFDIVFLCNVLEGDLNSFIQNKGYTLIALEPSGQKPTRCIKHSRFLPSTQSDDAFQVISSIKEKSLKNVDLIVVDHYALDYEWESLIKDAFSCKLLAVDDLADRKHDVDALLDQNILPNYISRYDRLVSSKTLLMLGSDYALLRDEFITEREKAHFSSVGFMKKQVVTVFMGGADKDNETLKSLNGIVLAQYKGRVDVILGSSNPNKKEIQEYCERHTNFHVYTGVSDIAKRFNESDLTIGACGSTSLERACLGVPSLIVSLAFNQEYGAKYLDSIGVHKYIGPSQLTSKEVYAQHFSALYKDKVLAESMSLKSKTLVDGKGVKRVVTQIGKLLSNENSKVWY